jgi:stage II sporulation protein D
MYRKISISWLIVLLMGIIALSGQPLPVVADSLILRPTTVRVALATNSGTSELSIQQGNYQLVDMITQLHVTPAANARIVISPVGSLNLRVESNGSLVPEMTGSILMLKQVDENETALFRFNGKTYRGSVMLHNNNGSISIINILDVEQYLYGVLPKEMGISTAPLEALKAQAVVSRTYALKQKNAGAIYDLSATTSSQVYGGYSAEVSYATAAVDQTKGLVIYYNNELINAYFSANAGGYTENAENVWNLPLGYAKAIASPYDAVVLNKPQDSTGWPGYTYEWKKHISLQELQSLINQWNQSNPNQKISVGTVSNMTASALAYNDSRQITQQPNVSGRITKLDIIGSSGSATLYKESIRSFLGLRSNLFTLIPEGGTLVRNGAGVITQLGQSLSSSFGLVAFGQAQPIAPNNSSYYIITADGVKSLNKEGSSTVTGFQIAGKGYGHGVGLSQWGAIGMAEAGYSYLDILEYYYNQGKKDGALSIRLVTQ